MKLRFSIGRTGNDDTGGNRFLYRGTMKQDNSGYNIGFSNSGALGGVGNGITEAQFESPFLSWEIEDKRNFGIDLGLFDNRIDLQVDYFNNKRKDILLQRNTVSNVTGFQQMPWQNFGIVKNQGVDASLNLNYKVGEVNLSARATLHLHATKSSNMIRCHKSIRGSKRKELASTHGNYTLLTDFIPPTTST